MPELEGGILEAFGKLFTKDLRIYVYPLRDAASGALTSVENAPIPAHLQHLYQHLVERHRIKAVASFDESVLHVFSRDVVKKIKDGDSSWEAMVPTEVARMVQERKLFGYRDAKAVGAGA